MQIASCRCRPFFTRLAGFSACVLLAATVFAAGPRAYPEGKLPADRRLGDLKDLDGKVLGTQLNSAAEFQAKQLMAENKLNIQLKSFDSFQGAYLDLKNGNVDAVTSTQLNDRVLFEANKGVYEVALKLPIYNYVGVAVRQQDKDLLDAVNAFLDKVIASGELAELQKKWFGYAMDLPKE